MKNLLVIGCNGQLARAMRHYCPEAIFVGRDVIDLSYPDRIAGQLVRYTPAAIMNVAAYTQVDNAEKEEELAFRVNAYSPQAMAQYCASCDIPFIDFSSDYVFKGEGDRPWKEEDATAPLNAYGRSKETAEKYIVAAGGKYLVFRTSWLYDSEGKNFPNTILRLAAEREELRIIDDQFGAPTYSRHLAKAVLAALDNAMSQPVFPSGIYHLCNAGVTTWYGFAGRIIELARAKSQQPVKVKQIHPISATEYPLPAKRPHNSRLDCGKIRAVLGIAMPDWQEGLRECMKEKFYA